MNMDAGILIFLSRNFIVPTYNHGNRE
jgi:hypothetical protein